MEFVYTGDQNLIQNTMAAFCIKVDGITLHDYTHFKDYRRGYVHGTAKFDFLTIPFAKSIEIGFLDGRPLGYGWYVPGDIASVVVWQDED